MNKNNGIGFLQSSPSFSQKSEYDVYAQKSVDKVEKQQGMLVSSDPPTPLPPVVSIPILMYGGIAVAVIISMGYFSQIQLKLITELIKTLNKKTK
ncbi:MAG: hypothetical protein V7K94_03710 [Nostoc sp.]|uniref:hypothetical protein n=1 Tax=Nostoc sp. TaxID=1180 RepID=UPI002FF6FF39